MELQEKQPGLTWSGMQAIPFKAIEVFSFAEDIGFGNNFGMRTHSALKRCLKPILTDDGMEFKPGFPIPKFDPQIKVRVSVEFLMPGDPIDPPVGSAPASFFVNGVETSDETAIGDALDAGADAIEKVADLTKQLADMTTEARAWQTTAEKLGFKPEPEAPAKLTKTFLKDQNKESLQSIATSLGISTEGTNAELVEAILAKQG